MTSSTYSITKSVVSGTLCSAGDEEQRQATINGPSTEEKTSLIREEKVKCPKARKTTAETVSMSRWKLEEKGDAPWSAVIIPNDGSHQVVGYGRKWIAEQCTLDVLTGFGDSKALNCTQNGTAGVFVGIGAEDLVGIGQQFDC